MSSSAAFADQEGAGSAEERLRQLGIELPRVAVPSANYVTAVRLGNVVFLAGTGPQSRWFSASRQSRARCNPRRGKTARAKCRASTAGGAAGRDRQSSKVVGFGRVFGNFADHPKVIDGCSDLFVEVFGDQGRHARRTVGMNSAAL
jgi:enamine deaminase RidA (YjgF/YER057c/UK114 family)